MRARNLVLALSTALLGCTSNTSPSAGAVSCGAGTMLKGSECVPSYASGFAGAGGAGGVATTSLHCADPQGVCQQCLSKSCGVACDACQASPDCVSKITCIDQCNDDTCAAGCLDLYPLGVMAFESFAACRANSCAKACAPGAGGAGGAAGASGALVCSGAATDPCDQCGIQNCGSQCNDCNAVPDCTGVVGCLGSCSDQACASMCASQYPNGAKALNAFALCLKQSCAQACSSGGAGAGGN